MSVTNDSQLAQPQGAERGSKVKRPWWVTMGMIWFILIGLEGGINVIGQINRIAGGQVDWVGAAQSAGVQADLLKTVATLQVSLQLALSLALLASCIGMWSMKKWGAVICLVIAVLVAVTIILSLSQGTLGLPELIEFGSFVLIGIGQVYLWRKGSLT